ncbi:3'(2'),5'-bisphosphate nucleotidase CysQ [Chryseolinea sp. H1M3-3]|uniref:3'(2'),5'-bisphosphate nucleotidase CysQ n=1 Tax=Chryseolinea sp. H1M3-3 TaxID=3034144 RepID=UPI0023EBD00F|nr:3'(2'),5'-bisphosphate nucleotidase CysQ [Chryseolinea sp. H1M3-3]
MNTQSLLEKAVQASEKACVEILEVYHSGDFQAELKGDNSPLTLADKKAHDTITSTLQSFNLPILSEEGAAISYDERKTWEYFWMIDPLDGTKEFLKRNGEFTVNIALIHKKKAVLGVVAVPVTGDIYYASEQGAFINRKGVVKKLAYRGRINLQQPGLRVVASRSHLNTDTQQFIDSLKQPSLVSSGSSLKFMLLAEGAADVYPRHAPTMEWDTAAAHAIVNAVGLQVLKQGSAEELTYNKKNLLNPGFLVC